MIILGSVSNITTLLSSDLIGRAIAMQQSNGIPSHPKTVNTRRGTTSSASVKQDILGVVENGFSPINTSNNHPATQDLDSSSGFDANQSQSPSHQSAGSVPGNLAAADEDEVVYHLVRAESLPDIVNPSTYTFSDDQLRTTIILKWMRFHQYYPGTTKEIDGPRREKLKTRLNLPPSLSQKLGVFMNNRFYSLKSKGLITGHRNTDDIKYHPVTDQWLSRTWNLGAEQSPKSRQRDAAPSSHQNREKRSAPTDLNQEEKRRRHSPGTDPGATNAEMTPASVARLVECSPYAKPFTSEGAAVPHNSSGPSIPEPPHFSSAAAAHHSFHHHHLPPHLDAVQAQNSVGAFNPLPGRDNARPYVDPPQFSPTYAPVVADPTRPPDGRMASRLARPDLNPAPMGRPDLNPAPSSGRYAFMTGTPTSNTFPPTDPNLEPGAPSARPRESTNEVLTGENQAIASSSPHAPISLVPNDLDSLRKREKLCIARLKDSARELESVRRAHEQLCHEYNTLKDEVTSLQRVIEQAHKRKTGTVPPSPTGSAEAALAQSPPEARPMKVDSNWLDSTRKERLRLKQEIANQLGIKSQLENYIDIQGTELEKIQTAIGNEKARDKNFIANFYNLFDEFVKDEKPEAGPAWRVIKIPESVADGDMGEDTIF